MGRILGRGVIVKRDGWLLNFFVRPGDRYPTLMVRRIRREDRSG